MRLKQLAKNIFSKFVAIYAFFVSVWFLSYQFIQDSWWGLVVLDKFAEYFVLPAGLLFLLSVVTRKKTTILSACIPLLISLYFYSSFFIPQSLNSRITTEQKIRVATYNIWNHNSEIRKVISVINDTEADVIALQEITEAQREELIAGLKINYPHYHVSKPVYGGTTALFSRFQLLDVKELDIQIDRPSILANIVWNDQLVTVVSAHLNPSFWAYWRQPWPKVPGNYLQYIKDQNAQVLAIQTELERRDEVEATILACDCNSQETASTNRILRKTFKDTFRTLGWQTGSINSPNLRFERNLMHIDYHWYAGNLTPIAIYRGTQTAESDHEPVIADFVVER